MFQWLEEEKTKFWEDVTCRKTGRDNYIMKGPIICTICVGLLIEDDAGQGIKPRSEK
jgi:hypothetical protein